MGAETTFEDHHCGLWRCMCSLADHGGHEMAGRQLRTVAHPVGGTLMSGHLTAFTMYRASNSN